MSTSIHARDPAASAGDGDRGTEAPRGFPGWFRDRHGWIAATIYVAAILLIDHQTVAHLGTDCGCAYTADPTQWMWSWEWIPYAISHGMNPFFTHEIWYPGPFNLAAVTMAPVLAIPGAPLEALFGPTAAWNLLAFTAPVVSGWAAYRLCRYLSGAPWASILAGYTYGFSAYEWAHQLSHMNLIWTFAPPLLALVLARLLNGEISHRRAAAQLAVLFVIEFGISTELFFTMMLLAGVAVLLAWPLATFETRKRLLGVVLVLVVACMGTAVVWSYYIYESFQGPAASKGFPPYFPGDLLSYIFPSDLFRIGANRFGGLSSKFINIDLTEQNGYVGVPLILISFAYAVTLWRKRLTKVVVLVTGVAFVLSLGDQLTIAGSQSFNLPYNELQKLPLFDLLTPSRFGLYVAFGAAVAVTLWLANGRGLLQRTGRWLLALIAVAFLIPNNRFSNFEYSGRQSNFTQPAFFTTGLYKRFIRPGEVVLPLPWAYTAGGTSLLWQADTHMYFKLASGYWGPVAPPSYDNPIAGPLSDSGSLPTGAAQDFSALTKSHDVTVVLVTDGFIPSYLSMLKQAGWRVRANVGGILVYRQARF